MTITKDEYELPTAIYDSMRELSEAVGINSKVLHVYVARTRIKGYSTGYAKVEIEDDEDDKSDMC